MPSDACQAVLSPSVQSVVQRSGCRGYVPSVTKNGQLTPCRRVKVAFGFIHILGRSLQAMLSERSRSGDCLLAVVEAHVR